MDGFVHFHTAGARRGRRVVDVITVRQMDTLVFKFSRPATAVRKFQAFSLTRARPQWKDHRNRNLAIVST